MASSTAVQPDTILKETTVSTSTNEAPKKISKGHRCYFCGEKFMDKNYLRKHISSHKDREYFCEICKKGFCNSWGLKKHMKIHTGERQFLCDKCPKTFVQKCSLFNHIKSMHESDNIVGNFCKSCGKKLRSRLNEQCWLCKYLDKEIPKDGKIPIRSDVGFDLIEVNNAQNVEIGSSMYISEKVSDSKDVTEEETMPVVYNVKIYSKPNNLTYKNSIEIKNKTQSSDANVYICHHCKAELHDSTSMKEHIQQTHPNLAKYVCEKCGKDFVEKNRLSRHILIHRKDRPFVCKVCQSAFKTSASLKQHAATHNPGRPYSCKDCETTFKTLQGLKLHVTLIHTKSKLLPCKHCGRTFNFVGNLRRHLRIHTGERPYKCNHCDKTFSQSSGLRAHEQTHQRNVVKLVEETCNVCMRTFKSLSNFKKHQLTCC